MVVGLGVGLVGSVVSSGDIGFSLHLSHGIGGGTGGGPGNNGRGLVAGFPF